jgi:DNA topoisomerase-1
VKRTNLSGVQKREEDAPAQGFSFIDPSGDLIDDEETLTRIKSLAIPPAYTDVWICPLANGHLQATGRDARGRKQYRYHPQWRRTRDESKFGRMIAFGNALPNIRAAVARDLTAPGLTRDKLLATLVRLLETTRIRVGNDEYARQNRSFGLTTMQVRHVDVEGATMYFSFRGKSGKHHKIELRDRKLARILARCREIPGREIFCYLDPSGNTHRIHSEDVNEYIRTISGGEFTAKDFRTWAGTLIAAEQLCECGYRETESECRKAIVNAVAEVAEQLGNTPEVCKKSYIHPGILDAFSQGAIFPINELGHANGSDHDGISDAEAALIRFLENIKPSSQARPESRRQRRATTGRAMRETG